MATFLIVIAAVVGGGGYLARRARRANADDGDADIVWVDSRDLPATVSVPDTVPSELVAEVMDNRAVLERSVLVEERPREWNDPAPTDGESSLSRRAARRQRRARRRTLALVWTAAAVTAAAASLGAVRLLGIA